MRYSLDQSLVLDERLRKFQYFSQLGQDLWVMLQTDVKPSGFFVEVGAANGIELSNTYALEKYLGWGGICVEPSIAVQELRRNRKCAVDDRCVWARTGEKVEFLSRGLFGGIVPAQYRGRVDNTEMKDSISLDQLLQSHGAPRFIDFLSIDTEGTEFDIISGFDFDRYIIPLITIEHNGRRQEIADHLARFGYARFDHLGFSRNYYHKVVFQGMADLDKEHDPNSQTGGDYDDWYVRVSS